MKMKKFINKIKCLTLIFAINFFINNSALSEQLKSINIEGNNRLADETIILFSNLKIGDDIDSNIINNTFKNLFQTNYFKDLKINFNSVTIFSTYQIFTLLISFFSYNFLEIPLKKILRKKYIKNDK